MANMDLYISGPVAISEWKCSTLIYLTILPYLSVFLCYVAHSSDLGMIIIGLRSLSCSPADLVECMYTNTPTAAHMNEGANAHYCLILHWVSSAEKKRLISFKKYERMCHLPSTFFIHNTRGWICYLQNRIFLNLLYLKKRQFRLTMYFLSLYMYFSQEEL